MNNNKEILLAEPKFDEELSKWTIEVEKNGEKLLLGHIIDDLFFEYEKYDTNDETIEYIKNDERSQLRDSN